MEFHEFPLHFGLQNSSQNHLKIDSGRFWRQSGIVLVLQGRIWMDSERLGLDFSLIWDRFCLYFRVDRAWLLQTIARWTICISCCTQHGIVAFTLHFLADIWCGGVRIAPGIASKSKSKKTCKFTRIFHIFKKRSELKRWLLILSPWLVFRKLFY